MLTRIEIDGFKTFEKFALDLEPLTAIVGPNASGKSNLFDALRFLSLLAQFDIRTAMQAIRGEPDELFRRTAAGTADRMTFVVEVLLNPTGMDPFGTRYDTRTQRLHYKLILRMDRAHDGIPRGVFVQAEECQAITRKNERPAFPKAIASGLRYTARKTAFMEPHWLDEITEIRQDGPHKHGRPMRLSLKEASRTALSTITTAAEFPHLFALRSVLASISFLEINPRAARNASDRFEDRHLKPDASNLAAVLARLKKETADALRPDGVLADIAADLGSLVPSVRRLDSHTEPGQREYGFSLEFHGDLTFSSRVISDGTLRLLALLTILDDPSRRGTLCFEEPENGVHEGRVPLLVQFLRDAAQISTDPATPSFQILLATHSPRVMAALHDRELVAADSVITIDPATQTRSTKTRMRKGVSSAAGSVDQETTLSRAEVERLLQHLTDAA